jgi:3-oxoacyl-[acyl-carrier protein] reductase
MSARASVALREIAVITGASRGIGAATARAFAARGIQVAMIARAHDELETASRAIAALGIDATMISCDVADPDQVARAARSILSLGTPRVVVNNAGIVHRGKRVHETDVASWDEVIAVNLRGPFLITRALLPAMLVEKRGRFIQIASISATIGSPGAASYAASKWGVVGFSKSLAEELRGTGLQSIAILPGSVDTQMLEGSGFTPQMSADDVAKTIVFAALDAPDALNGSAIEVFG